MRWRRSRVSRVCLAARTHTGTWSFASAEGLDGLEGVWPITQRHSLLSVRSGTARVLVGVFHVKHQGWTGGAVGLDKRQRMLLVRYEALLRTRAVPGRMIAAGDEVRLRERHVLDCLRGALLLEAAD